MTATVMKIIYSLLLHLTLLSALTPTLTLAASGGGAWQLLQKSIGISAMHMQLLHNDRVIIFDRTDFGLSKLPLPDGKCRNVPNEMLPVDCSAHSVEYNVLENSFRPLMVQTDVWCSSGSVTPDGKLIQTGGFHDGSRVVRVISPETDCDWQEIPSSLSAQRWYSTNHILPDGKLIIIGGRRQSNYEFYPKKGAASNLYRLPFLVETQDDKIENNLYPFVFLNVDGFLFIFANNRAILFDYTNNKIVKTYPAIPNGDPRSYPSTGSAVLLPLKNLGASVEAEVLVCGGAPKGSYDQAVKNNFLKALDSCGRIKVTDATPEWVMETMPSARVMGDMTLLPNGNVLIINGASRGTAGWEHGRDPVLNPVLYRTCNPVGSRFETQNPTTIARMYHSAATLLRDGRVLVGGSNPHIYYNFTGVTYPTELSLEGFSPDYLDARFDTLRPKIIVPDSQSKIGYGLELKVQFAVSGVVNMKMVSVTMVAPSFSTHSFSMNHRLLVLDAGEVTSVDSHTFEVVVTTPGSCNLAPAGYYLLFVVHQDIPSDGIWVLIQ